MQAIILAGGFGTRLKSVTDGIPKPMADIAGRPFLCWLLEYMEGQGVREAALCLHHEAAQIQRYFGSRFGAIRLRYLVEEKPLGTGGAVRHALEALASTQPVIVLNGDSLVEVDYRAMVARHLESGRKITIAAKRVGDCRRYSQLTIADGRVAHYELLGGGHEGAISTGFYVVSPGLFADAYLPAMQAGAVAGGFAEGIGAGGFSLERDFLALHTPWLSPAAFEEVGYFIDIGVPEDYARAQMEVPARLSRLLAA